MPENEETIEELTKKIKDSFSPNKYPGDNNLVYDNGNYDLERMEIAKEFKGKKWNDLSLETLCAQYASLFFFTPEAYRYYLPAFLLASIIHYVNAAQIPDSTIFSLTAPETQGQEMDDFLSRVNGFSLQQKTTIRQFLEFMITKHTSDFPFDEPNIALDRFWKNY